MFRGEGADFMENAEDAEFAEHADILFCGFLPFSARIPSLLAKGPGTLESKKKKEQLLL
jgi:hypothetical protein